MRRVHAKGAGVAWPPAAVIRQGWRSGTGHPILAACTRRRVPERLGVRPIILLGLGMLASTQLLFLPVRSEWMFIVPGIGYGIAHAILFPTVVICALSCGRTRRSPSPSAMPRHDHRARVADEAPAALS